MDILVIKTSSMGDVIHALPAITDAAHHLPNANIDWVVEPAFAEIPAWHPNIRQVIPAPLRQCRKHPIQSYRNGTINSFLKHLRQQTYDVVIDAQGLMKSALITLLSRGRSYGLDYHSAWEPLAALIYQEKTKVNPNQHAIVRMRQLFSQSLNYTFDPAVINYGLNKVKPSVETKPYLVFVHSTTWVTKEWPEAAWRLLLQIAIDNNFEVLLPWGNTHEHERAQRIAADYHRVTVLPKTSLTQLSEILAGASGVVSVDTGLGHLSAALDIPTVSLYGPTNPDEIGTMGANQAHISVNFGCATCPQKKCHHQDSSNGQPACMAAITPDKVWQRLTQIVRDSRVDE